ncbi:putative vacuolar import/degradation protein Vid24 [Septoria linicola]|nr:putative vacuolar import/degradation protein Vid24 [Septoria linicola]
MPPSNTPNDSNARRPPGGGGSSSTPPPPLEPAQRPLTPLSYLSSPVPDLASTLHNLAAEEADEANVSFLRDSLESLDRADGSSSSSNNHGNNDQDYRSTSSSSRRNVASHNDPSRDPRLLNHRRSAEAQAQIRSENEDVSRRLRLQRVLARLNQIHDPAPSTTANPANTSSASAYSNRTPSPGRNNQYDWAPPHETSATNTATSQDENELDQILAELRRQPSGPSSSSLDTARLFSQSETRTRERNRDSHAPSSTDLADVGSAADRQRRSLRSRAALQRARQESSPSATERILRYAMERRGAEMSEEEERARAAGWFSPSASSIRTSGEQHRSGTSSRDSWPLPPSANEIRSRTMQERAEAMQRRYGENALPRLPRISTPPVPSTTTTSSGNPQFLENALKYLDQLRSCYNYEQALSAAIDHGLATKEFFADKHDDFVMDLTEIDPVAGSSWLQPGTIFEGHQHATSGNAGLLAARAGAAARSVEQINPNFDTQATATGFDHPPGSTSTRWLDFPNFSHHGPPGLLPSVQASSANMLLAASKGHDPAHDHWPVRVIIHSIDTEKMSLQGTMEAYDVPQHPHSLSITNAADRPKAGKKNAPITTYLEGHVIDLETHSFLTPDPKEQLKRGPHLTQPNNASPYTAMSSEIAFPSANPKIDASNWRKLPPFNSFSSDDEFARVLLSKDRMSEVGREYIFMRWKERCFVHRKGDSCSEGERDRRESDQDRGHGLTISGFYYVSLKRQDGAVEGLYFDPQSTPYQCLRLRGKGTGWASQELR